jgi:hypothetical protein
LVGLAGAAFGCAFTGSAFFAGAAATVFFTVEFEWAIVFNV